MNTNINDHSEKDVFVEKRIFLVGFFWSVLDNTWLNWELWYCWFESYRAELIQKKSYRAEDHTINERESLSLSLRIFFIVFTWVIMVIFIFWAQKEAQVQMAHFCYVDQFFFYSKSLNAFKYFNKFWFGSEALFWSSI